MTKTSDGREVLTHPRSVALQRAFERKSREEEALRATLSATQLAGRRRDEEVSALCKIEDDPVKALECRARKDYLSENKELQELIQAGLDTKRIDRLDVEIVYYRVGNPFAPDRSVADYFGISGPELMLRMRNPVNMAIRALFMASPDERMAEIRHVLRERLLVIVQEGTAKDVIEAAKVIEGANYLAAQARAVLAGVGGFSSGEALPTPREAVAILAADPAFADDRPVDVTARTIDVFGEGEGEVG